jgi:hypothetical protein
MPVFQRDGSPHYLIEFKFQGRRFRRSSGTTSKREAQELERRWRGELREQLVFGEPAPMSWGEALDRYFTTVIVPKENPRTTKRDAYVLEMLRKEFGANRPLAQMTAPAISTYRDRLLGEKKKPATVNRHLAAVKAITAGGQPRRPGRKSRNWPVRRPRRSRARSRRPRSGSRAWTGSTTSTRASRAS